MQRVGKYLVYGLLAFSASACGKLMEKNPAAPQTGYSSASDTSVLVKPVVEPEAIGDHTGIAWPLGPFQNPSLWRGATGDRTGGGTLSNPCGTGQMNSHSQADYYSRDLSRYDGTSRGRPVYAGRSGIVIRAGWDGGYGNSVVIWVPGENIQIRYAHLDRVAVGQGYVSIRQYIGTVGSTSSAGNNFSPHLHLTVYKHIPLNRSGTPQFVGSLCRDIRYACAVYFFS